MPPDDTPDIAEMYELKKKLHTLLLISSQSLKAQAL